MVCICRAWYSWFMEIFFLFFTGGNICFNSVRRNDVWFRREKYDVNAFCCKNKLHIGEKIFYLGFFFLRNHSSKCFYIPSSSVLFFSNGLIGSINFRIKKRYRLVASRIVNNESSSLKNVPYIDKNYYETHWLPFSFPSFFPSTYLSTFVLLLNGWKSWGVL